MKNIITLDTIMKDTIWIAKMQGWRESGTYAEIGHLQSSEECRDFDICAKQPAHLEEFFDRFNKYTEEHGFITIPDYYKDIYLVDMQTEEEKPKQKRIWTEDEIRNLVQTNDKVLYGALLKLYGEQTKDEQFEGETRYNNGVGFNGADSKFLSSVSEFLKKRGFLTPKQKAVTRRKLIKYNKQLTRLANEIA